MLTHTASDSTKTTRCNLFSPLVVWILLKAILLSWGNFWSDWCRRTRLQRFSHIKLVALLCFHQPLSLDLSDEKVTAESLAWKCATRSVITSRSKWLQEYPKRGPLTMHRHGLNGNASQHQTMAHSRTHLWRELYYKLPPSAAVPMRMGKGQGKEWCTGHSELGSQRWQWGPDWRVSWPLVHIACSWSS